MNNKFSLKKTAITFFLFSLLFAIGVALTFIFQQNKIPSFISVENNKVHDAPLITNTSIQPQPILHSKKINQNNHCSSLRFTCTKPISPKINQQAIYRWEDDNGLTHFSDQPQHKNALFTPVDSHQRFFLEMDTSHASLPPFAISNITRDINGLYQLLINNWGVDFIAPIHLKLKLFDQKEPFIQYQRQVAPALNNSGGFYIHHLNEASVLTLKDNERTYAVTRHEAMHAINAQAFGRIPTWLNEGLAEYAEKHQFQYGNHYINEGHPQHLALLRKHPKVDLQSFFFINGESWYQSPNRSLHYATAWSLIYFFRSSNNRKKLLTDFLNYSSDQYCQEINTVDWFNKHYPGGVKSLQEQWNKFIKNNINPHYY